MPDVVVFLIWKFTGLGFMCLKYKNKHKLLKILFCITFVKLKCFSILQIKKIVYSLICADAELRIAILGALAAACLIIIKPRFFKLVVKCIELDWKVQEDMQKKIK